VTIENYNYRTSPFFLRNQFLGKDEWKIPIIPKAESEILDVDDLRFIGFDRVKIGKDEHFNRMVHFFLYDYKFEDIWKNPHKYAAVLKNYKAVLSPDFSMYTDMHPIMQLYNVFRNRWVGAYLANEGLSVIPTVSWGNEETFDFCFEGIEKGSVVAISTYMVQEHHNHSDQKDFFLKGYNEMLRRIEPYAILCYSEPFPEMHGNVIHIDYDLSSWKHEDDDKPKNKSYLVFKGTIQMGMGHSGGGEWKPSKEGDKRFLGEPGSSRGSRADTKGGGYDRETYYGDDGRASWEQHNSDHGNPADDPNPHGHDIDWSGGFPDFGPPMGLDSFMSFSYHYKGAVKMHSDNNPNNNEENRFRSISDFKWCMKCGGEVEFCYKGRVFGIFPKLKKTPVSEQQILVIEKHVQNQETTKLWADNADAALEYLIAGVRLRDIITEVEVTDRTV
jgi:hypothetical protein